MDIVVETPVLNVYDNLKSSQCKNQAIFNWMLRVLRTYKAIISIIDKNLKRFQPMFEAFTQCPRSSSSISLSVTMTATSRTPTAPSQDAAAGWSFLHFWWLSQSSWISSNQRTKMIIKDDQKTYTTYEILASIDARKCVGIPGSLHVPSQLIGCGIQTHSQILRDLNQANDLRSCLSASILHHILQQHLDASRISGSSSKS